MLAWLRRQAIAALILLCLAGLVALAWIWVTTPQPPGILHAIGGVP